jgi:hypothetical protein
VERVGGLPFSRASLWKRALSYLSLYPALLLRALRLPRADVVGTLTDPPLLLLLGPLLKWTKGSRLVHWAQDLYPEVAEELGVLRKGGLIAHLCRAASTWALRRHDCVVVVGRCMKQRVLARGVPEEIIRVIPNWAVGQGNGEENIQRSTCNDQHRTEDEERAASSPTLHDLLGSSALNVECSMLTPRSQLGPGKDKLRESFETPDSPHEIRTPGTRPSEDGAMELARPSDRPCGGRGEAAIGGGFGRNSPPDVGAYNSSALNAHGETCGRGIRGTRPSEAGSIGENSLRRQHQVEGQFVVMYSGNLGLAHPFEAILDAAEQLQNASREPALGGASVPASPDPLSKKSQVSPGGPPSRAHETNARQGWRFSLPVNLPTDSGTITDATEPPCSSTVASESAGNGDALGGGVRIGDSQSSSRRGLAEIVFLFVGSGPRLPWVKEQVAQRQLRNVRFLPSQPRERLAESLGAADVHLVSMHANLSGLVVPSKVYGVLAAGRPCVFLGPETSEAAQVIGEHGCGEVLSTPTGAALAASLVGWRNDAERRQEAGRRALTAAAAAGLRQAVAAFDQVLRALVRAPGRGRVSVSDLKEAA